MVITFEREESGSRTGQTGGEPTTPEIVEELRGVGNHRRPDHLVEPVLHRDEKQIVISLRERHDGERGMADVEHRILPIDPGWEGAASIRGREAKPVRYQDDRFEVGMGLEAMHVRRPGCDDRETSV